MRGILTESIADKGRELMGRDIDATELRLMPYIQFVMANSQRVEISRINSDERAVLSRWREEGRVDGGASPIRVTREFWGIINELVWLAYVNHDGDAEL